MSNDAEIVVAIKGDDSGGRVIKKTLDDLVPAADKATSATTRLEKAFSSVRTASIGLSGAMSGLIGVFGLRELGKISDQYLMLGARLKNITGSTNAAAYAMKDLQRISSETGTSIEASLSILQRLSFVREEINATNKDMLNFTETVSKLGVMSGASSDALKFGLTQLGQSLSSQIMRAEEFNSIMENIPGVGKAIADQFGVTTGQLRQLVINGKVLSADVFSAILNQTDAVNKAMAEMPKTIERAGKEMGVIFDTLVAKVMNTSSASDGYVKVIEFGNDRLKEMVATVDIIRLSFDFMADRIKITFNNIAYEIQSLYNKASVAISDMTAGKVDLGIKSDVFKLGYSQTLDQFNAAKANAVRAAMGEQYGPNKPNEKRTLSRDYAAIADKLGEGDGKLSKAQREALKAQKKLQDELNDAVKDSRTETEKLYDKIKEQEALRPFAKTAEQATAISKNIKNAQDELEKLRVKAELDSPMGKAFKSLAKEIDGDFKEAFKDAFKESDGGFKKLISGWKNAFKDFLADLAYQAAVRPILVSLAGGIGASMGISTNAAASVLGTAGGASGGTGGALGGMNLLSSGGTLLSGAKTILTGGYSSLLGNVGGGLGEGVGKLLGMDAYSAIGLGDKFAGVFGNAGLGAVGALGANLFGLGNKNGFVNAGFGTAGSLIGSFAGGPIGALAGGFLGTALGGLFGGGKPTDGTQGGGVDLASGGLLGIGGMTGKKYSAANATFRDSVLGEVSNLVKLLQSVGASTSGRLDVAIGSRDGLRLNDGSSVRNFGTNSQAFINAMMEAVLRGTTGLTGTFKTIVDKIGVSDTKKLATAFEFGKQFDAFLKAADNKPADVLKETLDVLNAQFDTLKQQTLDLGLPIDKLTEAYDKQKTVVLGSIKAQMAGFNSLEDMTKAFKNFLDGQALGNNSSLSPTQKLALAQDNFGSLLSKAQSGDYSVTQDLLKAANELLDIGRGVYASSVSFAGLEGFVRSSVQGVARGAGVPGYETTDPTNGLTTEIIRTNAQLTGSVSEMVEVMKDLLVEAQRTRKLQESIRNQQAVGL